MIRPGYLVIQLREGDIVSMCKLYQDRSKAFQYIEHRGIEPSSSWWKVVDIHNVILVNGRDYDIVLNVRWQTTNAVTVIGVYDRNMIPDNIRDNYNYFAETLTCE